MKKLLFILLVVLNLYSSTLLEYDLGIKYLFDSNIGQNTTEVSKHYVVPKVGFKLFPLKKTKFFIASEVIYDCYVTERDPDDNSPFLTGGIGIELGKKKFKVIPDFFIEQYFVTDGYTLNNDGKLEKDSWISFLRTYNFRTMIIRKKKRIGFYANAEIAYRDYGDIDAKNEKDGVELKVVPELKYLFKKDDEIKVGVKSLGVEVEYTGRFTEDDTESFNKMLIALKTDFKFWRVKLDLDFELARKMYIAEIEHPHSGDFINEVVDYLNIKPSIKVDIIADLKVEVGSALRFRRSDFPDEEYSRHTVFTAVDWNSKIKRKKK